MTFPAIPQQALTYDELLNLYDVFRQRYTYRDDSYLKLRQAVLEGRITPKRRLFARLHRTTKQMEDIDMLVLSIATYSMWRIVDLFQFTESGQGYRFLQALLAGDRETAAQQLQEFSQRHYIPVADRFIRGTVHI